MTSTSYQFPAIIFTLVVAFVTIGTRLTGRLYPVLPSTIVLALGCLLIVQFKRREFSIQYLGGYVALSVFYRTFAYLYPPSFIGADSDEFAFYIARLLLGNHFSSIPSRFYSGAPGFFFTGEVTTMITGGSIKIGLLFPAVLVGIVFPIVAFVLPRYLPITDPKPVQFLAAAITVMAPTSVALTSNPIPQVQSVVLTLTGMISLAVYVRYRNSLLLFIPLFCFSIILFTHRLAPYTVMLSLLFASGLKVLRRRDRVSTIDRAYGILGLALTSGVYLQAVFAKADRLLIGALFLSSKDTAVETAFSTTIAELTLPFPFNIFFNVGYRVPLFVLAGLGWLVLLQRSYDRTFVRFVLVFVGLNTALVIGATLGILSNGPFHFILPLVPLLAVLASISSINIINMSSLPVISISISRLARVGLGILLLISLISGQSFSLVAASDSSLEKREYLTSSELTAKEWMNNHTLENMNILTDGFYAKEIPPDELRQYARQDRESPNKYQGVNKLIISGMLADNTDCVVALRPGVYRYSHQGNWQLTEPVTRGFATTHMIYSSGLDGVNVFWGGNCSTT